MTTRPDTQSSTLKRVLTTAQLGARAGYSTQQVRDLERLGVLPPAERGENGYRRYQEVHVSALLAYRSLVRAVGPIRARAIMPTLLEGSLRTAAAAIDDMHAAIASDRAATLTARRGLDLIRDEAGDVFDAQTDSMSITELGRALGVRSSTLRHWESEGLVRPDRITPQLARHYGWRAIIDARIVAILRAGGHPIPKIAAALSELPESADVAEAQALLDAHLDALGGRSLSLLEAAGHLHALLTARTETR